MCWFLSQESNPRWWDGAVEGPPSTDYGGEGRGLSWGSACLRDTSESVRASELCFCPGKSTSAHRRATCSGREGFQ